MFDENGMTRAQQRAQAILEQGRAEVNARRGPKSFIQAPKEPSRKKAPQTVRDGPDPWSWAPAKAKSKGTRGTVKIGAPKKIEMPANNLGDLSLTQDGMSLDDVSGHVLSIPWNIAQKVDDGAHSFFQGVGDFAHGIQTYSPEYNEDGGLAVLPSIGKFLGVDREPKAPTAGPRASAANKSFMDEMNAEYGEPTPVPMMSAHEPTPENTAAKAPQGPATGVPAEKGTGVPAGAEGPTGASQDVMELLQSQAAGGGEEAATMFQTNDPKGAPAMGFDSPLSQGLMVAGLSMLGGGDPYANNLSNIGQGLMAGLGHGMGVLDAQREAEIAAAQYADERADQAWRMGLEENKFQRQLSKDQFDQQLALDRFGFDQRQAGIRNIQEWQKLAQTDATNAASGKLLATREYIDQALRGFGNLDIKTYLIENGFTDGNQSTVVQNIHNAQNTLKFWRDHGVPVTQKDVNELVSKAASVPFANPVNANAEAEAARVRDIRKKLGLDPGGLFGSGQGGPLPELIPQNMPDRK